MSRGKAQELISSGRVQLNYRETLKSDAPVAQGDVISARGPASSRSPRSAA